MNIINRNLVNIFVFITCFCIVPWTYGMYNEGNEDIVIHRGKDQSQHRYGKVSDELMDVVYSPDWRHGVFKFRPGVQSGSYTIPVRLFFDSEYFQERSNVELVNETQFQPIGESSTNNSITGVIPASKLLLFNNVPGILAVESPRIKQLNEHLNPAPVAVPQSNPEYLKSAGVPEAWKQWGKGEGVKVGIIDGGFITLPMLFEAGILSQDKVHVRQVLPDELHDQYPYGTGIHGAAVAEVIHEVAPEAELYIYPTMVIPEMWEKAVLMAVEDGVHIINSSMNSSLGVLDGFGIPNKFIDPAINAGILYINSAGNYGASTYVAPFNDPDRNGWHNYTVTDEGNTIYLNKGQNANITLVWDDFGSSLQLPNSDQDLDLYLFYVDPNSKKLIEVASSTNDQKGETSSLSMPAERLSLPPEGAPYSGNYSVMIKAHQVNDQRVLQMRLIAEAYDSNNPPPNIYKRLQYSSRQMTMTKPADDPDILTIAACGIDGNVHSYSGTGPTESGELKPDFTGYAGLLTSSMLDPFFGTSCAAPFVAGCAALLWQEYPSADSVKQELRRRAINPSNTGSKGFDPSSGWGIVNLLEPDPQIPSGQLITASRVNDILDGDNVIGVNFVTVFTIEKAKHDRIVSSIYFLDSEKKPIQGVPQFAEYHDKQGLLRISSYVTPSVSDQVAFELWMVIPSDILNYVGDDALIELRLEHNDSTNLLDRVLIGTVQDLKPNGTVQEEKVELLKSEVIPVDQKVEVTNGAVESVNTEMNNDR